MNRLRRDATIETQHPSESLKTSYTAITVRKYGACLTALARYDEAEANLLEAHEILVVAVGADHAQTLKVIPNLVALYQAWNKPEQAAEWRAKFRRRSKSAPSADWFNSDLRG